MTSMSNPEKSMKPKPKKEYTQNYGFVCKRIGKPESKCINVIKHIEPFDETRDEENGEML